MANEAVNIVFSAVDKTGAAFSSIRGSLSGLGEQVMSVRGIIGTLGAAFGAGAFAAGIKHASEAADSAAKMSDRFGIATEKLIGLTHAGDLAGASQQSIATGMKNLANIGVEAARGVEDASRAFDRLNINAGAFLRMPMDQQFSLVIDKLRAVENVTLRNQLANQMLGKSYGELMGLIADGSEALKEAQENAQAWGLAINRVDAAKLEMANDAIKNAQKAAQGLFTTIAIHVAPVIKLIADYFSNASKEANGFRKEVEEGMSTASKAVGTMLFFLERLQVAYSAIKFGIAAMGEIALEVFQYIIDKIGTLASVAQYLPGPFGMMGRAINEAVKASSGGIAEVVDAARLRAEELRVELDQIALSATSLEDWQKKVGDAFKKATAAMQEQAEIVAQQRQELGKTEDPEIEPDQKKGKKDNWREQLEAKIERIREENMTELQLLDEKLREKNLILQAYGELGAEQEAEAMALNAQLLAKHEENKTKIIDNELKKRYGIANVYRQLDLQSTQTFFGYLSGMMDTNSKRQFKIGKAAAIAETTIKTYNAAMGAFQSLSMIPIVGSVLGAIAAAAVVAVGLAQVQKIKNTEFGGGGVSGGAIGTFTASPTTGLPDEPFPNSAKAEALSGTRAADTRPMLDLQLNVSFSGSGRYTQEEIREAIIPAINEAIADGVQVGERSNVNVT